MSYRPRSEGFTVFHEKASMPSSYSLLIGHLEKEGTGMMEAI